ncbi:nucleoside recognition domain-containing protein [Porphyromonas circumdentaria]|uniref:Spore maturation protein SpmA n=1 Tax=Porphyromonas circumdentaria TaxID=29524 RepID=A0A1T4KP21_9PORP|nr:nucleoside recognition domain-containing protein [Porphyromonas circumdentaria]MBB6274963.1 spore maturation protein SpmA [Porphyromonas circumdentaria]MDO4722205.1 nucleoside recognition domain-containing protein [Porphyromonas circumdentaria]SJZ44108.1 Spore maturation protein SpmA [Porphyromonas circumdentaria]
MALNYLFLLFILGGVLFSVITALLSDRPEVFQQIVSAIFDQSTNAIQIVITLTGVLCFFMGVMKVAERSGAMERLALKISPLLGMLFPSIPKGHPVLSSIFMNLSANLLGLDNAATPLGLQSMQHLQDINLDKNKASDAMIMFIALNASGLTLIPISVIAFRLEAGAANPTDVFLPILLATLASTMTAVTLVALKQKINLLQKPFLLLLFSLALLITGIAILRNSLSPEAFSLYTTMCASLLLLGIISLILIRGIVAKINVYDAFVEGAKEGISTAVKIVPYLLAMLVAIGVFRASGGMDVIIEAVKWFFSFIGVKTDWVEALPTILMKPLSGNGARALMVDTMHTFGADSLVGRLASVVQGSTDTTFYIIALYFGSVGIKKIRYTAGFSLLADLAGAIAAIIITYLFFVG